MSSSYSLEPIGIVECRPRYRYEAPKQGIYGGENEAVIRLNSSNDLEQALKDLEGFERIWVLFIFHLNERWHPMVHPPYEGADKVGVFASRSPHRPNRIGMSCVELLEIDGLCLKIKNHDLLDLTPVIDIKPYLPYADAFPNAKSGWLEEKNEVSYTIQYSPLALEKINWVKERCPLDIANFIHVQLQFSPTDQNRKRIQQESDQEHLYTISFRTWRIHYKINEEGKSIFIEDVSSGYTNEDLDNMTEDPYLDKELHRSFSKHF